MARVLDRAHDGDVELTRREQVVQLGRRARDELGRHWEGGDTPVNGSVHGIAVDVADPADSHAAHPRFPGLAPGVSRSLFRTRNLL